MRSTPFQLAALGGLVAGSLLACAASLQAIDLAGATATVGRFQFERRLEQHRAVDAAATAALQGAGQARRTVVASADLPDGGGRLELATFRGDGRPDQFAFVTPGTAGTADFGYLFDLDGDGRFDWIVFNGGPLFDSSLQHMHWMNYHWIDTDGDGRVDVLVFNAVDLDGDHFFDPGVTAWLYDRDHDGLVEEGEYLGPFGRRPVERQGAALVLSLALGEQRFSTGDPEILGGFTKLLGRINALGQAPPGAIEGR
jgi:hypothetical protein